MAQVDSGLELGWGSTFAAATTAAAAVLRVLSPGRMNVGGGGWGVERWVPVWLLMERIRTA